MDEHELFRLRNSQRQEGDVFSDSLDLGDSFLVLPRLPDPRFRAKLNFLGHRNLFRREKFPIKCLASNLRKFHPKRSLWVKFPLSGLSP